MLRLLVTVALIPLALLALPTACAAELSINLAETYQAQDTLSLGEEANADARACLEGLAWQPAKFTVTCQPPRAGQGDVLIRFPSPISTGDALNDQVAMEWYIARDDQQQPRTAPAIVIVHESGSRMTVGRLFARGLQFHGFHTFLIHLPKYGERRREGERRTAGNLVTVVQQAVGDVRRARDAVAALPLVDRQHIALQGTSLGGFVSATAASLDDGFDSVFLTLAGGQLYDVIQNGQKDAIKVRQELAEAGLTGERLKTLLHTIEPTRIAHRLDPTRTWLYSGTQDTVVPLANAQALARSARLAAQHHVQINANHYSGIIYLPFILNHIREQITRLHADE